MSLAAAALAHKERTVAEVVTWLADRDVPSERIEETIEQLLAAGVLDDEGFAERFASDKRELAGWGGDRIAEALSDRGIDRHLIDRAVSESDSEQTARAAKLLTARGADVGDEAGRNRALGLLARRGFPLEVAYEAVRAVEREEAA